MRWSWRLLTIFGIDIKVHATFVLALLWGGFLWSNGGWTGALYGVFLTLVLFVIVVMHELGHSLVARRYGIRCMISSCCRSVAWRASITCPKSPFRNWSWPSPGRQSTWS